MEKPFLFEPHPLFAEIAAEMVKAPAAVRPALIAKAEMLERCFAGAVAGCLVVGAMDHLGQKVGPMQVAKAALEGAFQMAWIRRLAF